jgi:flagellar biosynthesis GTPase FlhF
MEWQRMNNKASARTTAVVEAPTLKEALRLVRSRHGEHARVIRSRSVTRRQVAGLGHEKVVEVFVETAAPDLRAERGMPPPVVDPRRQAALTGEIAAEVARIEELVRQIAVQQAAGRGDAGWQENPVAARLIAAGADPGVVVRLAERCQAETGAKAHDQRALLHYLARSLPTGRGGWAEMTGMHVLLGAPGIGRTELLLKTAGQLAAQEKQVLVLCLSPRHGGEIRRLQAAAAAVGFDAAVIQSPRQLATADEHLSAYDVVLLDAPSFGGEGDKEAAGLQQALIQKSAYHRHLVVPLDRDLRDGGQMAAAARAWNCDWLALTRLDQTAARGKLLDLLDRLPLPVSLVGDVVWPQGTPRLADPGHLIDLMLGAEGRQASAVA